jgi:endoglucanase
MLGRRTVVAFGCGLLLVATAAAAPPQKQSRNPFASLPFFVDPHSDAARQAQRWQLTRPVDAAAIEKIAREPAADAFAGETAAGVYTTVRRRVRQIARAGKLPVLVAYDIPHRDCGSYSAGGARSSSAYRRWIRGFALGIGRRRAVVILEPDALPELECLTTSQQRTRLRLLRYAVRVLGRHRRVATYIDAGQSAWRSAAAMTARLRAAGVAQARGFSLNVASFWPTADQVDYGDEIGRALGGKHYVVDTSRNGLGPLPAAQAKNPEDIWCNPPGRALGDRPTVRTASPLADAYFWIKRPGDSDGPCNGGPPPGRWWPEYALGLALRAPG